MNKKFLKELKYKLIDKRLLFTLGGRNKSKITMQTSDVVVDAFIETLIDFIRRGERVNFERFGAFVIRYMKPTLCNTPPTRLRKVRVAKIVPGRVKVKFLPSKRHLLTNLNRELKL